MQDKQALKSMSLAKSVPMKYFGQPGDSKRTRGHLSLAFAINPEEFLRLSCNWGSRRLIDGSWVECPVSECNGHLRNDPIPGLMFTVHLVFELWKLSMYELSMNYTSDSILLPRFFLKQR